MSSNNIYVTGFSGYLGKEIMAQLEKRGRKYDPRVKTVGGKPVIHCAWMVTKYRKDWPAIRAQLASLDSLQRVLVREPLYMVFPSTMAVTTDADTPYVHAKRLAEGMIRLADVPACIIRFPGLVGGDRTNGTWYTNHEEHLLPDTAPFWQVLDVQNAAQLCIAASRLRLVGTFTPDDLGFPTRRRP